MAPQVVMTLPLLEGTDGTQKMSKSLGNYVGVTESADEIFGKIMSISDEIMLRWYDLLDAEHADRVRAELREGTLHPREAKAQLAEGQAARFHGASAAAEARVRFDERFARGHLVPESIEEDVREEVLPDEVQLPSLLAQGGLAKSNSDARRLIAQGAVRVNGEVVRSERFSSENCHDSVLLVEVGKRRVKRFRFARR
jgi:tyrosyl-tRNA synthetase